MNVVVAGGGPGGLYAALLIKKADPRRRVEVVEKNPRGATYGWGVVFSDRTLASFREADYPTYAAITDDFVIWDSIDILYRDRVLRCGGQPFSGIARVRLLEILQERCADLGVGLAFRRELTPDEVDGADLVIAADGVHSVLRGAHAQHFGTTVSPGRSKYIWYGTDYVFDSFTFMFKDTEHGLLQVHAYPFDGERGTFIVETDPAVWRGAGLDRASEAESIAFCEKVFASELAGRSLMSNNSKWIEFVTIRNGTWHRGNLVLLGDAAHTAHFSIGSGTKMAMEDAIALSNSLDIHEDLGAALAYYELDRRPRVERLQEAARRSQGYFENMGHYMHLDPLQFAFHLLTRSGRQDYGDVRVRDRRFVAQVDGVTARRPGFAPPPAFNTVDVGGLVVPNRVVLSPDDPEDAVEGLAGDAHEASVVGAAGRAPGLVVAGMIAVSAHGRISPGSAGLYADDHAGAWRRIVAGARAASGCALAARLGHSGRRGSMLPGRRGRDRPLRPDEGAWTTLAPSPIAYGDGLPVPAEMDASRRAEVINDFVTAARRAAVAGFDAVMLEMGRGYLLGSFLSPLANERADEDAGSRFPLELFAAVRAAWKGPLGASINGHDWARGGTGVAEACELAIRLREHGCAFIEVRAGGTVARTRPRYDAYHLIHYAERIRGAAGLPVVATGNLTSVDDVNTIVGGGRADLCLLLEEP